MEPKKDKKREKLSNKFSRLFNKKNGIIQDEKLDLTTNRDELASYGYVRSQLNIFNLRIPSELWSLIFTFYHIGYEILKFSFEFQSKKGLRLLNDNKCIKRVAVPYNKYKNKYQWVIATQPVFKGIHCWRVFVENPNNGWIMYGISKPNCMYQDNTCGQTNVIGIAYNNFFFCQCDTGNKQIQYNNHGDLTHFNQDKILSIDMLLDCDIGTFELCVVGKYDKYRPKFQNLDLKWDKGWVPHFNLHETAENAMLRLVKIDDSWYGKEQYQLNLKCIQTK